MISVRLAAARQPTNMWAEAMNHADKHHDYFPCYANPDLLSPYEMRTGKKPDLARLHTFGELCFVLAPKSDHRALPRVLIGYEDNLGTKAYRLCFNRNRVYISRDVRFMGRMYLEDGPTPDVSLLTVDGIAQQCQKFCTSGTCASKHCVRSLFEKYASTWDNSRLENYIPQLFKLTARPVQVTDFHTPASFWDMLKCPEKQQWLESMREEEDALQEQRRSRNRY